MENPRRRVTDEQSSSSTAELRVPAREKDDGADSDYASETENGEQRPDKPCHKHCESLFSSGSGFQNYRGLLNNCILLLVLSNSRNVINNLLKYGILVDPMQWIMYCFNPNSWPSWGLLMVSWVFPLMALVCEKFASKGKMSNQLLLICHLLNLFTFITMPMAVVFILQLGPVSSISALAWYAVAWLKLVSYMQVNWWCRTSYLTAVRPADPNRKAKHLVQYPNNLNVKDLLYFYFAPTLCYELNFPRNKKIRKIFLLRRLLESIFIVNVMLAILQQWLIPTVLNSLQPFKDMEYPSMIERVFLLALPNHLFWLLGFYWLFHSMMNVVGELLRFADRKFYGDWWNAQTIAHFWKSWNIPVHRWASRHIYNPLVSMGVGKLGAQISVFLLSAAFHEYLVSIPLLMLRPWAFVAMISQVPLGILTALPGMKGQVGNIIVWCSIVLGQPVAILMYMHDYYWIHVAPSANATLLGTSV